MLPSLFTQSLTLKTGIVVGSLVDRSTTRCVRPGRNSFAVSTSTVANAVLWVPARNGEYVVGLPPASRFHIGVVDVSAHPVAVGSVQAHARSARCFAGIDDADVGVEAVVALHLGQHA